MSEQPIHITIEEPNRTGEKPLAEVKPIHTSLGMPLHEGNIEQLIEEPLRKAIAILLDKNIPTFTTSANYLHITQERPDSAGIGIDWKRLSPTNQEIAQKLAQDNNNPHRGYQVEIKQRSETNNHETVYFIVPVEPEMTSEEIERRSVHFANQLVSNDVLVEDDTITINVP